MLDYNNIKIGDTVIAVVIGGTKLIRNKKYIIENKSIDNYNSFSIKVIGLNDSYFTFRFKLDLKTIRQTKLKQLYKI